MGQPLASRAHRTRSVLLALACRPVRKRDPDGAGNERHADDVDEMPVHRGGLPFGPGHVPDDHALVLEHFRRPVPRKGGWIALGREEENQSENRHEGSGPPGGDSSRIEVEPFPNMAAAFYLLLVIGHLGFFDVLYFHIYRCGLHRRPECQREVFWHTMRHFVYGAQFLAIANLRFHGMRTSRARRTLRGGRLHRVGGRLGRDATAGALSAAFPAASTSCTSFCRCSWAAISRRSLMRRSRTRSSRRRSCSTLHPFLRGFAPT